jgi:hypothetical protein
LKELLRLNLRTSLNNRALTGFRRALEGAKQGLIVITHLPIPSSLFPGLLVLGCNNVSKLVHNESAVPGVKTPETSTFDQVNLLNTVISSGR